MEGVANFKHHNTSTLGHIFVQPEELQPCKHKVESVARRLNQGKCPVCHTFPTNIVVLDQLKAQIADWVSRNDFAAEYAAAVAAVAAKETSLMLPALNFPRRDIERQFQREVWAIRAIVVLLFFAAWWYEYISLDYFRALV